MSNIDIQLIKRVVFKVKPGVEESSDGAGFKAFVTMGIDLLNTDELAVVETIFRNPLKGDDATMTIYVMDFNGSPLRFKSAFDARLAGENLAKKVPTMAAYELLSQHGIAINENEAKTSVIRIL